MAWLLTWLVHGFAIALIARLLLRSLRGLTAATRYAIWWAALVLVLLLPAIRGWNAGQAAAPPAAQATDSVRASGSLDAASRDSIAVAADASVSEAPRSHRAADADSPTSAVVSSPDSSPAWLPSWFAQAAATTVSAWSLPAVPVPQLPDWLIAVGIGVWLGYAMLGLAQIGFSLQVVGGLKRSCRRLAAPREAELPMWSTLRHEGRHVRVRECHRLRTPAVLGFAHPIIAIPRDAARALTPADIDRIILHEYAHVQRFDDWTKLAQLLISAFFRWHPAIPLMLREIDLEREAACDDFVVERTGAPRAYARCLTKIACSMPNTAPAGVPSAASSTRHITIRIERLLDRQRPVGRLAPVPAMAATLALTALAFCTVHAWPVAADIGAPADRGRGAASALLASAARTTDGDTPTDGMPLPSPARGDDASASGQNLAANDRTSADTDTDPAAGNGELQIAAASMLPLSLPLSRFSRLAGLTTTPEPGAAEVAQSGVNGAIGERTQAALNGTPAVIVITGAGVSPTASAPVSGSAPATAPAPAAGTALADGRPHSGAMTDVVAEAASTAGRPASSSPSRAPRTSRVEDTARLHESPSRPYARPGDLHATTGESFTLGSVGSAAAHDGMLPAGSDDNHIERAWNATQDATSRALGVSGRAVGSATRTAAGTAASSVKTATQTATTTAAKATAAGVKTSSKTTARAFSRAARAMASIF